MTTYEAIMIAEGVQPSTEEIYIEAWQYLIDSGACWNLQGWFGRQAAHMIEEGLCQMPAEAAESDEVVDAQ